ncbi:cation efflux system protein [Sulfurimonas denitrificans DSM 1251]|jgi:Cu(I)/Ag(I) efflux system membrane fusion protein|uniref:Cation efflux system protein n=1 Tax=Sulfurimonas denitrificans (strain ATCC 33889 / DSM 1251) TaxID=326298 RepID=Q30S71_SULDN|nr:efflux RND transporter periplasmic adaptor subunit [Sulfurimonas denitrificans]ABB44160.1 cation efflux system protein [Sulfurimonas denitrificans DSM 1251]MDD3441831.1 efflux RND transporter periplasmic adaptor subunit [Sulfurimonas denitrificans]
MKIIFLIMLIFALGESKTIEQTFNIKSIKPKIQTQKISKTYYATTSYNESKIYEVSIRFDGFIENLGANELYKKVKKGDKLFDIYSKEIYTLKKELASTKNFPTLNSTILEKLKLYELDEKAISSTAQTIPLYSKFNGDIIEKNILEGSYAKAGTTLLKIADSSNMWIIAKVYQRDFEFIKQGMSASVEIEGFSEPRVAKVSKIYPKINKDDLTFNVRVDLDNAQAKITPDMFAKVSFSNVTTSLLSLPKDAVIKRGDKFYVFKKVSLTEYEPQEVEVRYAGGFYQILGGVDESSEVAQNALFLLDSDAVTNGSYMSEKW